MVDSPTGPLKTSTNVYFCRSLSEPSGDAVLEYVQLAFNQELYLVGLSGVPDFKLTLWNWQQGHKIHSIDTKLGVSNVRNSQT